MPNELDSTLTVADLALEVVLGTESVIDGKHQKPRSMNGTKACLAVEVAEDTVFCSQIGLNGTSSYSP